MRHVPLLAAALAFLLLAACRHRQSHIGPFPNAPVILISIDTLRADHLRLYGYKGGSTPALDALARDAIVFDDVQSHCPLTLPAHASMFTGLLPPHHGVRDNIGFTLDPARRTIATRFKAAGWDTGAAVSAYVLRRQTGIAQGFDFYDDALEVTGLGEAVSSIQRDGAAAVESLTRWIDGRASGRVFAFLHLYEPHTPYTPPARYQALGTPYDGEIGYADELVGRFVQRLRASGLFDRAIVAVVSDHGEGLGDHGEQEHGIFLYEEALHVPFILRLPGGAARGTRVKGTADQMDLAATLLDLAGVSADGMDGASLGPAIDSGFAKERTVYSETLYSRYHFGWAPLYSATDIRYRFVHAPHPELYDRQKDPAERSNLAASRVSTAAAMDGWLLQRIGPGAIAPPSQVSAEARERLKALGYIGSTAPPAQNAGALPDPKDEIGAYEELKRAMSLRQADRTTEAVTLLRKIVADNPRMLDAWETLGVTLVRMGRTTEGIAALSKVLEIDPMKAETHLALARVYALNGKGHLAEQHATLAVEKEPGQAYEILAQLMMDRGRLGRAAELAARSVASDDQRYMSQFILGMTAQRSGRCDQAIAHLASAERSLALQKQAVVRNLHAIRGDCLARLGRTAEAEKEFRAEIEASPKSREARVGLAMLYRSIGRDAEMRSELANLISAEPRNAEAYWIVVRTLNVLGDETSSRAWARRARALFPSDPRFR